MKEALPLPFALAAALYLPTVQDGDPPRALPREAVSSAVHEPSVPRGPAVWRGHPRARALFAAPARPVVESAPSTPATTSVPSVPLETIQDPPVVVAPQTTAPANPASADPPPANPAALEADEMRVLLLRRRLDEAERRLADAQRNGPVEPPVTATSQAADAVPPPHPLVHPDHARAARAATRLGKLREAREHWLHVDSPWASLRAAECLERLGRQDEALREYDALRQRHPQHEAAHEARRAAAYLRWRAELLERWPAAAKRLGGEDGP